MIDFIRQNLTSQILTSYKVDPRIVRVKNFIMAVDHSNEAGKANQDFKKDFKLKKPLVPMFYIKNILAL